MKIIVEQHTHFCCLLDGLPLLLLLLLLTYFLLHIRTELTLIGVAVE